MFFTFFHQIVDCVFESLTSLRHGKAIPKSRWPLLVAFASAWVLFILSFADFKSLPLQIFTAAKTGVDPCSGQEVDEALGTPKRVDGEIVLVTGGSGFIGSHLVEQLLELGYVVRVYDNLETGNLLFLNLRHPRLQFVYGDIMDVESLRRGVFSTELFCCRWDLFAVHAFVLFAPGLLDPNKSCLYKSFDCLQLKLMFFFLVTSFRPPTTHQSEHLPSLHAVVCAGRQWLMWKACFTLVLPAKCFLHSSYWSALFFGHIMWDAGVSPDDLIDRLLHIGTIWYYFFWRLYEAIYSLYLVFLGVFGMQSRYSFVFQVHGWQVIGGPVLRSPQMGTFNVERNSVGTSRVLEAKLWTSQPLVMHLRCQSFRENLVFAFYLIMGKRYNDCIFYIHQNKPKHLSKTCTFQFWKFGSLLCFPGRLQMKPR